MPAVDVTDPVFFARLENLELRARSIVEGFLNGLHRSPFVGFSVEFAAHREYVAGDDPRHVNWKLYARQHRLYVKEFDAETNLKLHLLVDISKSMDCANAGISKLEYATTLAAAMAHLALSQRDAVSLTLFADDVLAHIEPRARAQQLQEIVRAITTTTARPTSKAERALPHAVEFTQQRGIVVLISDLFDDDAAIFRGLDLLRFRQHEVLLFQLWDPWERSLPLDGNIRFHDLETGELLTTYADGIRESYQRAVNEWRSTIHDACIRRGVDRVEACTDEPVDRLLLDYLERRMRRM